MKTNLFPKVGDYVQSRYRSRWYGEVIDIIKRGNKQEPIMLVQPICTRDGRSYHKIKPRWLSAFNLDVVGEIPCRDDVLNAPSNRDSNLEHVFREEMQNLMLDEQFLSRLRAKAKRSGKKKKSARAEKKSKKADKKAEKKKAKDTKTWLQQVTKQVILPLYNSLDVELEELAPVSLSVALDKEEHPPKMIRNELFNNVLLPGVKQIHDEVKQALMAYLKVSSEKGSAEGDVATRQELQKLAKKADAWANVFNRLRAGYEVFPNAINGKHYLEVYEKIADEFDVDWISDLESEEDKQEFQRRLEAEWKNVEDSAISSRNL